ncbi:acyl carrier protein [Kribbella qitaiheensis]|uniref:Acyl carrier protein n=1 Tax=Kribbella qitaiheensis TaxID=1544730 RepID=A0A7G6X641_9ACTN|nr:acyl carrier protein [Kribbella qitaiheensis]
MRRLTYRPTSATPRERGPSVAGPPCLAVAAGRPCPPRGVSLAIGEQELRQFLIERLARHCDLALDEINPDRLLAEYGLASRDAIAVTGELEELLDRPLQPTSLWRYPTIKPDGPWPADRGAADRRRRPRSPPARHEHDRRRRDRRCRRRGSHGRG